MFILILLGLVLLVGVLCSITPDSLNVIISIFGIIALIFISKGIMKETKKEISNKEKIIGSLVILLISLFLSCFSKVETGHTGILISFGQVMDKTFEAGIHFKMPYQKLIQMDNRIQKQSVEMNCFSKDTQEVKIRYTLNYQINKETASKIYKQVGENYFETLVSPSVLETVKTQCAKFTADELIGNRNEFATKTDEDLSNKLKEFNVELIATNIEDIDFSDAYTNAVESKQVALQEKLKAEQEAEKKKVEADAKAYVVVTEAKAQAEANKLRQQTLNELLVKDKMIDKWDGHLPQVEGGTPIIDMRK